MTTSRSTRALTTSQRCARTSLLALSELQERRAEDEFRQAALDAAVARRRCGHRRADRRAREGDVGAHASLAVASRDLARGLSESDRARPSRCPERDEARRRAGAAARGRPHGGRRAGGIEPSDQDLLEAIAPTAEREGAEPQKLLDDLRTAGRLEELRESLAARQAVELIADAATPIPVARALAKEKLWTPGQERGEEAAAATPGRLWTPGR